MALSREVQNDYIVKESNYLTHPQSLTIMKLIVDAEEGDLLVENNHGLCIDLDRLSDQTLKNIYNKIHYLRTNI